MKIDGLFRKVGFHSRRNIVVCLKARFFAFEKSVKNVLFLKITFFARKAQHFSTLSEHFDK